MKIGVDIGGTNVRLLLVGGGAEVVARARFASRRGVPDQVVDGIASQCRLWREQYGDIEHLGIATAGWVDVAGRVVHASPNLGWEEVPLADLVEGACGLQARVENDVNAALLGEMELGAATGRRNCVAIFIGTGIGGGVAVDGRLVRGSKGAAAEVGHQCLDPEGPPCTCGRHGCWEAYSGGAGLVNRAKSSLASGDSSTLGKVEKVSAAAIVEAAEMGDPLAHSLWAEAIRRSVQGIANLAMIFDPEVVVVGGGVVEANPLLVERLRIELAQGELFAGLAGLKVVSATLGDHAACLGMALGYANPKR